MTEPPPSEDDALRALGRRARERMEAQPDAWEAVARGERSEAEVVAERLQAGDAPELVERAAALFRPPDADEHEALMDALLARTRPVVLEPTAAANDSGRAWLVRGLAVAAALVLGWWLVPRESAPIEADPPVLALARIPAYELLESDGGLAATRSLPVSPSTVHRYRADSELEWRVRPRSAVQGEVAVRLFAFGEGTAKMLAADDLVEVAPTGAVRVHGLVGSLGLARGTWTIAIVVGRPAALPSDPEAVRDGEGGDTWIVRRLQLVLED